MAEPDEQDIPGLREWLQAVASALELPSSVVIPAPLLDVARDVARGVIRPGAPTTTYLIGVAVGLHLAGTQRSSEDIASVVGSLSHRIQDLALEYQPQEGQH